MVNVGVSVKNILYYYKISISIRLYLESATCSCKNGKYSVIMCDEIIDAESKSYNK